MTFAMYIFDAQQHKRKPQRYKEILNQGMVDVFGVPFALEFGARSILF